MKAIDLLLSSIIPSDAYQPGELLDKKGYNALAARLAKDPARYGPVMKELSDLGRNSAYFRGETVSLDDMRSPVDKPAMFAALDSAIAQARQTAKSDTDFKAKRDAIWDEFLVQLDKEVMQKSVAKQNNLGRAVASGARGNNLQLRAMIATPGLYTDYKGRVIPLFSRKSYGEGLRPANYLASTFGVRSSVLSTKVATAKGGDLLKIANQTVSDQVVTEKDCGTTNGLSLGVDDPDLVGRTLARPTAGHAAGTAVDRHVLRDLRAAKVTSVLARSPITCTAPQGLCSHCLGLRTDGTLAPVGYHAGASAAAAVFEPVCLDADTLVRMTDWSVRKIKDLKPGDIVFGADLEGRLKPTRVLNVFHNGPRECVETVVRKGRGSKSEKISLVSTTAHKVLSCQHARSLDKSGPAILPIESSKAQHCVFLNREIVDDTFGRAEPFAALFGILAGDGCYNGGVGSGGVGFSCYDPELTRWVETFVSQHGLKLRKMGKGEYRISMMNQYESFQEIDGKLVRNILKAKIIHNGNWGQVSHQKTVPKDFASWNNASVAAYIGGLVATDGWVIGKSNRIAIGFGGTSKSLVEAFRQSLMERFGLYSSQLSVHRKAKPDGSFYRDNYSTTLTGKANLEAFQRLIPIPGSKAQRLAEKLASCKSSKQIRGRFRVISQKPVGLRDTWDIEVDNDTHLFALANGLVVSNTQAALNCLAEGTLVRMADFSTRPVEQIKIGELVLGSDKAGRTFPVKVLNQWQQGLQPVYRFTYKLGQTSQKITLEATTEHKLLGNKRVCSQWHKEQHGAFFSPASNRLEMYPAGYPQKSLAVVFPMENQHSGPDFPEAFAAGSANLQQLPKAIWNCSSTSLRAFVAGYVEQHGSVYTNQEGHISVSFRAGSKLLADALKELIAVRLCVYGSAVTCIEKQRAGSGIWQFCVSRQEQLSRLHGLLEQVGSTKIDQLGRFLSKAKYVKRHPNGFYLARKILSESVGPKPCWDLEVDHPDHLFVLANGIICSNSKHTSGAAKGGKRRYGGFEVLSALVQSPDTFPHKAAAASLAGRVDSIEPAPQGGNFITVAGTQHYALPGYAPLVKVGDEVEAGDQLSDGVMDAGEVVQYRGLGEGRRYYVERLQQAIQDSGMARPLKHNLEVLARAALNHVRVNDNDGYADALPDDFISYNSAVRKYSPPKDAKVTPLNQVGGKYLQEPALHFSIGTKLTPRMVKELKDANFGEVTVADTPPPFEPEMIRLRTASHAGKDWLAKMNTSYISSNLEHDAERGFTTNLKHNINFAPRVAVGDGFGKNVGKKGEF